MRAGDFVAAIELYEQALIEKPELFHIIEANLRIARQKKQDEIHSPSLDINHLPNFRKQQTSQFAIKLSIVCITYNHQKYIRDALDGFVAQSVNFCLEIIISDDASTDDTPSIIEEYTRKHPTIFFPILRKKNIGAMCNFVDALSRVRGEYVALCEGDDYWTSNNKLQTQVDYLDSHPSCSISFHPVKVIDESDSSFFTIFPYDLVGNVFFLKDIVPRNFIQTNSVVYRWGFHDGLGTDFNLRAFPADHYIHTLQASLGEIHLIPRVMAVYRKNDGGMFSSVKDHAALVRKWGMAHIELFRALNKKLNGEFAEIYQSNELSVVRTLVRDYLNSSSEPELNILYKSYPDTTLIALREIGYSIDQVPRLTQPLTEQLKKNQRISVVITAYNHSLYIGQCIESVLEQRGLFELQVIIADDCSTDGSRDLIESYAKKYPNIIKLLPLVENMGMLSNMQRAFEVCDGDFVAICEGDDYWISPYKLNKQLNLLNSDASLSMAFNWILLINETTGEVLPHPGQQSIASKFLTLKELRINPVIGNFSCCMWRKSVIQGIPKSYFLEQGAADWLFNCFAAEQGNIGFIKEIYSAYRIHKNGQWSGLAESKKARQVQQAVDQINKFFPTGNDTTGTDTTVTTNLIFKLTNPSDLKFNCQTLTSKYETAYIDGWLIDPKNSTFAEECKYVVLSDKDRKIVYFQKMQNIERPDVDAAFNDGFINRFLWSGFSVVIDISMYAVGRWFVSIGKSTNSEIILYCEIGVLTIQENRNITARIN